MVHSRPSEVVYRQQPMENFQRAARLPSLLLPLRSKGLRRLTIASLISELGDGITTIVFPLAVYARTSSGVLTGFAFAAVRAAGVVGTPVGGLLADRVDRLTLLRVSWVLRALVLTTGLLIARNDVILIALLLARIGGTIDNPAAEAAIREHALAPPTADVDSRQAVATIRKVAAATSLLVGPAVGGLLVSAFGVSVAVWTDVGTFLLAMAVLGSMRSLAPPKCSDDGPSTLRGSVRRTLHDAATGVRHLQSHRDLTLVATSATINSLLVGALLASAVVYLGELATAPDGAYGFTLAAYAAGSFIGLIMAGSVRWQMSLAPIVWRGMVAYSVICVAGVAVVDWRVLAVSWLVWGISYGPEEILTDVGLVAHTPTDLLGRTYGGISTVSSIGSAIGAIAGGLLGDVAGPRLVVAGLAACYLPAAVAIWWAFDRPSTR